MASFYSSLDLVDLLWKQLEPKEIVPPQIQHFFAEPSKMSTRAKDLEAALAQLKLVYLNMHACADSREAVGEEFRGRLELAEGTQLEALVRTESYRTGQRLRARASELNAVCGTWWQNARYCFDGEIILPIDAYEKAYNIIAQAEYDLKQFDNTMTRIHADVRRQFCIEFGIADPLTRNRMVYD